jgi:Zn-dependent protease
VLFLLRHPEYVLGVLIALVVGITLHSVAQAAAAIALGDRMPRATGRLSVDPRKHFEVFGIVGMLLSTIGWNKPVAMQEPRGTFRRGRFTLAILAGPLANLVLATLGLLAFKAAGGDGYALFYPDLLGQAPVAMPFAQALAYEFALVNAGVAALSLVPIPPLDGARLLWAYAPQTAFWRNARYQLDERGIGMAICVFLLLPIFRDAGMLLRLALTVGDAFLAPVARAFGLTVL